MPKLFLGGGLKILRANSNAIFCMILGTFWELLGPLCQPAFVVPAYKGRLCLIVIVLIGGKELKIHYLLGSREVH